MFSQLCITVYTRNVIHIIKEKKNCGEGGTHSLLGGGGGGGGGMCPPTGPPGSGTGTVLSRSLGGVLGIKYLHVFNFASY